MQSREYLGSILLSTDLFQYSASYAKIYPTKENLGQYALIPFLILKQQPYHASRPLYQQKVEAFEMRKENFLLLNKLE